MIRPLLAALSVAVGFGIAALADVGDPVAPDPMSTPGQIVSMDQDTACAWGRSPRLYDANKEAYTEQAHYVFDIYGIDYSRHSEFELDHLVPRCIGGADTVRNLWPQHCDEWSAGRLHCILGAAADKDVDERRICRAVCYARTMTIGDGQRFFIEGMWR